MGAIALIAGGVLLLFLIGKTQRAAMPIAIPVSTGMKPPQGISQSGGANFVAGVSPVAGIPQSITPTFSSALPAAAIVPIGTSSELPPPLAIVTSPGVVSVVNPTSGHEYLAAPPSQIAAAQGKMATVPAIGQFASDSSLWTNSYAGTDATLGQEWLWVAVDGSGANFMANVTGRRIA